MEVNWRSEQGKRTRDNRDCGGVGVRADAVLCLLLDGSTSAPTSGDLARQIIRDVVDWYVATDEAAMAESLSRQLRRTHRSLSRRFPRDSVSYVLAQRGEPTPATRLGFARAARGLCRRGHVARAVDGLRRHRGSRPPGAGLADHLRLLAERALSDPPMLTEKSVRASDRRAMFVGLDAYEAAGGVVLRNLFQSDDGGWLEDVALLDGLVAEKRKAEAETIAAEGWKWIELPGCEAHRPVRQLSALSLGGIRPLAWTCAATRA
jgi:hypothetical protein